MCKCRCATPNKKKKTAIEAWVCSILMRKSKHLKNLSQCCLSTTNPTWNDLGLSVSLQNDRPVTNHSGHGTASLQMRFILSWLIHSLKNDFTLHPSLTFHLNAWWQFVMFFTLRITLFIWWTYGSGKHRGKYTCTLTATDFHLMDRFCKIDNVH